MTPDELWIAGPRVPGAAATLVSSMLELPSTERAQLDGDASAAAAQQPVHVLLSFMDGSWVELPVEGSTSKAFADIAERIVGPPAS